MLKASYLPKYIRVMDNVFNHRAVACVKMTKHLLFRHKHFFISLVSITVLSACASKPRHVKADLPLVTQESSSIEMMEEVPEQYWGYLNRPELVSISHPNYPVAVGPIYFSALGLYCREVSIDSTSNVVCSIKSDKNNTKNTWYWVNGLVQDKLEKKL
ncbi:hypothetical protein ACX08_16480 [Vibrio parahaemolyticus]|nr:hypothetical protein ACX08_16480 [Vibrio parahaemolyticus]